MDNETKDSLRSIWAALISLERTFSALTLMIVSACLWAFAMYDSYMHNTGMMLFLTRIGAGWGAACAADGYLARMEKDTVTPPGAQKQSPS